jgi:hypothetical protein
MRLVILALVFVAGLAHAGPVETRRAFVLECVDHVRSDPKIKAPVAEIVQACARQSALYVKLFPNGGPKL